MRAYSRTSLSTMYDSPQMVKSVGNSKLLGIIKMLIRKCNDNSYAFFFYLTHYRQLMHIFCSCLPPTNRSNVQNTEKIQLVTRN